MSKATGHRSYLSGPGLGAAPRRQHIPRGRRCMYIDSYRQLLDDMSIQSAILNRPSTLGDRCRESPLIEQGDRLSRAFVERA